MFDQLTRELRRLESTHRIPVSIPSDADGYLDRQCPSAECKFNFKVHEHNWRSEVRDEEVFCPSSGHTNTSGNWCTEEQTEHLKKPAVAHVRRRIGHAMKRDTEHWNRRVLPDPVYRPAPASSRCSWAGVAGLGFERLEVQIQRGVGLQ